MAASKSQRRIVVLFTGGLALVGVVGSVYAGPQIRPAYCSGNWYPADPAVLTKLIEEELAKAESPPITGKPLALIAPHAGYRYSAPVAVAGYKALEGHRYERVIVLAFSHRNAGGYKGVDVPSALTAYDTPLGNVPIDRDVCDLLLKENGFSSHDQIDRGEHSLELQLPYLQYILKDFKLVPLLVGRMSPDDYARAAKAILPLLDENTLLVASTDFTHYGQRFHYVPFHKDVPDKLRELADQAAAPILACDFDGFIDHLRDTRDTICGRGPVSLLLRILSMSGGATGVRAAYDTSGRMMNDWTSSVTYQSFVLTRRPSSLDRETRATLLKLARATVEALLKGQPTPEPARLTPAARADGACFVTLENHGRLRGCIGNMVANGPLYEAVQRNAVSACHDHRFVRNPVTASELGNLDIEISHLTPMKLVSDTDEIVVGRDGLMITLGQSRGVLLPQVAARYGWTRETFLAQTCRKAGLPLNAWKRPSARIYSFQAEVFDESALHDGKMTVRK